MIRTLATVALVLVLACAGKPRPRSAGALLRRAYQLGVTAKLDGIA